jgi:hypothetical protein
MISKILKEVRNIPGKSINKKIIVFESDDWGSSRIDDHQMMKNLKETNYNPSTCWMSSFDSIERNDDLKELFDTLKKHKDHKGNHPKFTLFLNPANPDFIKIKNSNFIEYFFEPFTTTFGRYENTEKVLDFYQIGIKTKLIEVGFHGREHLYVNRWLRDLRNGDKVAMDGFKMNFWGFSRSYASNLKHTYRSAFDLEEYDDIEFQKQAILSGTSLIENILHLKPKVFVAPDGPYNLELNKTLVKSGIEYIGLSKSHTEPIGNSKKRKIYSYLGEKIEGKNLTVITRNSSFEPSKNNGTNWVNSCVNEIESAFRWKKPAIISTHRANYIGTHSLENRKKSLKSLNILLKNILQKWPDVIFLSSSQLGDIISNKINLEEVR